MNGKICKVNGATSGIGLVTARELTRHGATVIIVGRNRERGRHAVETIQRETGNPSVEFLCTDLSSQAAVRHVARDPQAAARLWQLSEDLTQSGVTEAAADHAWSNHEGT